MRKTKSILISSFLLFSSIVSLSISGCESNNVETIKYGAVTVANDIENGSVSASKLGNVKIDTIVTIIASPNEGYEIDSYYLNDTKLDSNTFKVKEGSNVVKVTFIESTPISKYGTVEVISSKVNNGTITVKLKDGTPINKDNKRLPIDTEVVVEATPVNKAYQIESIKLNDNTTINKDNEGNFTFKVIEGKNFLSATFSLINPNKGLIDLDETFTNGTVVIKNGDTVVQNGSCVDENTTLTITATANDKYITRYVKVNGSEIAKDENSDTNYSFSVKEGLVSIEVSFVFKATAISINIPESWIENQTRWGTNYFVEEGETYDLTTTLEPEGSFAELVWEKGSSDKDIEITSDGKLTILNASENTNTIYVSLKDNDSIKAEINVKPISSGTMLSNTLKDKLATAKEYELNNTKKVTFTYHIDDDYSSINNEYSFESYSDGYTVTKVTDKDGAVSYLYQGIVDNVFYTLNKNGQDVSVINNTEITEDNKVEYQGYLNTFGSAEFLENTGIGDKYTGLADFYSKKLIDGVFSVDGDEKEIRSSLVGLKDANGYKFTATCITTGFRNTKYKTDVTSTISFTSDGGVDTLSYKRVDHEIDSDGNLVSTAKDQITEYTASIEYGQKEADNNKYFNFDNYYYSAFDLNVFTSKSDKEGSKITPTSEGKYNIIVSNDVFVELKDIVPSTALAGIDEITTTKDSGINVYGSVKYGFTISAPKKGEYNVTFASKNVSKTLTFVVSYAAIENVELTKAPDSMYCNDSSEIKAIVNPSGSVENSNVTYTIEGDNLGCTIEKSGSKFLLKAGNTAGSIVIKATAEGDSSKFVTKTIEIKAVPSIYESIKDKTYSKSVTDWSTYDDTTYTLTFTDVSENTLKGTLVIKNEPYYYGETTIIGTFTFDIVVSGNTLTLTNITCDNAALVSKLNASMVGALKSDGTIEGINIVYNGETLKLLEKTSSGSGEIDPGWDW